MDDIAVSVIVPIYRVEQYIHQCVNSLLAQTLTNIEIILVNDGSPDGCGEICDKYASTDKRIKVIHQQNSGVSAARNNGIKLASGEYIGFVDGDDWVTPQMFECLYNAGKDNHCDIVSCDFTYYFSGKADKKRLEKQLFFPDRVVIHKDNFTRMFYIPLIKGEIFTSVWRTICTRALLVDNMIMFPAGIPLREDYYFYMDVISFAHNYIHIAEPLYFYRARSDSCGHGKYRDYFELSMGLYETILDHMDIWGMCSEEYLKLAYLRCLILAQDSIGRALSYKLESVKWRIDAANDILSDAHVVQAAQNIMHPDLKDETLYTRFMISAIRSKNIYLLLSGFIYSKMIKIIKNFMMD